MFATQQRFSQTARQSWYLGSDCVIKSCLQLSQILSLHIVCRQILFALQLTCQQLFSQVGKPRDNQQELALKDDCDEWKLLTYQLEVTPHCRWKKGNNAAQLTATNVETIISVF